MKTMTTTRDLRIKKEKTKKPAINRDKDIVEVRVWDVPTRALHWMNALLVLSLIGMILGAEGVEVFGMGEAAEDALEQLHASAGRIFAVTFVLRVIWGFIGNQHARFSDMIPCTKKKWAAIGENLKWYASGCKGEPPVCVGHNPLAALFYLALFVVLALQVVTGLLLAGTEFDMFPGTLITNGLGAGGIEFIEEGAEEIHEFGLWFMVFFFAAHIGGLIVHTIHDKGGLIISMITGKKYFHKDDLEV